MIWIWSSDSLTHLLLRCFQLLDTGYQSCCTLSEGMLNGITLAQSFSLPTPPWMFRSGVSFQNNQNLLGEGYSIQRFRGCLSQIEQHRLSRRKLVHSSTKLVWSFLYLISAAKRTNQWAPQTIIELQFLRFAESSSSQPSTAFDVPRQGPISGKALFFAFLTTADANDSSSAFLLKLHWRSNNLLLFAWKWTFN